MVVIVLLSFQAVPSRLGDLEPLSLGSTVSRHHAWLLGVGVGVQPQKDNPSSIITAL